MLTLQGLEFSWLMWWKTEVCGRKSLYNYPRRLYTALPLVCPPVTWLQTSLVLFLLWFLLRSSWQLVLCFSTQKALVIQGAAADEQAKDLQDVILLSINLVAKTFLNWPGSDLVSLLFWDIASSYRKKDEWLWDTLLLRFLTQVAQDLQSSYHCLPQRSLVQCGKPVFRPCWQCAVGFLHGQGRSSVGWRSPPPTVILCSWDQFSL